jgi:glyoxylase-like metal-dependent hydrolase (beta-lactamase superfamily II)
MKLDFINPESWRMDGGAAFGLVPKTIWNKQYPADDLNNVGMKQRCMIIEDEGKLILIDTGMGNKKSDKYYKYKYISERKSLQKAVQEKGYSTDDFTDVILTHLHDDHVGGAVFYNDNDLPELVFKNATHWVAKSQWDWAINPNKREAGTFFKENLLPIDKLGKLKFIDENQSEFKNIDFRIYNGHTVGQLIPFVNYDGKTIVYMADFIPTTAHIPIPYIAGVDIQPLKSLDEKEKFLEEAAMKVYYLFFEHDFFTEVCNVKRSEKGIILNKKFELKQIL